jgi:hypothetical protein
MTDEELNETAKMMEWMMADWARASPEDSDWCAKAASAIRQLMRERDELALRVVAAERENGVMRGALSLVADSNDLDSSVGFCAFVARDALKFKHPPAPS